MELETGKKLRTGAVIVAAGHKSKNSVFKLLRRVDSTAIRRIIITLKRAGVSPIVVVTGDKADELEKHISNLQVICLRNEQYAVTQMFSSICMGLNYIEDLATACLCSRRSFRFLTGNCATSDAVRCRCGPSHV